MYRRSLSYLYLGINQNHVYFVGLGNSDWSKFQPEGYCWTFLEMAVTAQCFDKAQHDKLSDYRGPLPDVLNCQSSMRPDPTRVSLCLPQGAIRWETLGTRLGQQLQQKDKKRLMRKGENKIWKDRKRLRTGHFLIQNLLKILSLGSEDTFSGVFWMWACSRVLGYPSLKKKSKFWCLRMPWQCICQDAVVQIHVIC